MRQTHDLEAKIVIDALPFAQLNDERMLQAHPPKRLRVGAQRVADHHTVPAVIFNPRDRKPIAETVHLYRIKRVHSHPALDEPFDQRPARVSIPTAIAKR